MPLRLPSDTIIEVGVDEVGRGCIFGDVVAAAVVLPYAFPDDSWTQIKDSKKLSKKKREDLAEYIKQHAIAYGIGTATAQEIDDINILQATMTAMHRACDVVRESVAFEKIVVDGNYFKKYKDVPHETVKGGDNTVLSIAAASILAKTYRDNWVTRMVDENPTFEAYGLRSNMGYGTAKHMDAIVAHGLTTFHRKTFGYKGKI